MKSHLLSYPCPLQINSFWNLGFLLGITIILQIITGIFLGLHYTSDLNSILDSSFLFIATTAIWIPGYRAPHDVELVIRCPLGLKMHSILT